MNALMGRVLGERLLGVDIGLTESYLDVPTPNRNPVMVHVSLATEPRRLLEALRSNGVGTIEVDVAVFDANLAEWTRGGWSGPFVSGSPQNGPLTRLDGRGLNALI